MKSLKFLLLLLFLGTGNILQAQELSEIRKRFESLENNKATLWSRRTKRKIMPQVKKVA